MKCAKAVDWCNAWSEMGLFGLYTSDSLAFRIFREAVAAITWKGMEFNSYPKDGLSNQPDISILLQGPLLTYDVKALTKDLCDRNYGLYGCLKVIGVTGFGDKEVSRKEKSKKGWRLVQVKGDNTFLTSLKSFPYSCLLYTSPSPRDLSTSRMPSSA